MRRLRALLAVLVAAASIGCGAAAPTRSEPTSSETATAPAEGTAPVGEPHGGSSTAHERHPSCPARYDAPGPSCDGSSTTTPTCEYPEGTCFCGQPRSCSGAAPRPGPPPPPTWVCHERERECPPVGSPCRSGDVCAPWCCGVGAVCLNGYWAAQDFPCPP
ncbi:MAG: hypothetical protein U0230_08780 [Polyangiales bacterium]